MILFTTTLLRFQENGEKTGWTYIRVTADQAEQLKPGTKTSFRVKGKLDSYPIREVSLIPIGEGEFILAVNASMRKAIGKQAGASVAVQLEADERVFTIPPDIQECIQDEPAAASFFQELTPGHQRYFINWILSAKTEQTRTKRIAQMVTALAHKQGYPDMVRAHKQPKS